MKNKTLIYMRILLIVLVICLIIETIILFKYSEKQHQKGISEGNETAYKQAEIECENRLKEAVDWYSDRDDDKRNCILNCRVDGILKTYYDYACVNRCLYY